MSKKRIRIATRQSKLALWQAHAIKQQLLRYHPHLKVELFGITTSGDKYLSGPLRQIADKSLFVKELEQALLNGEADLAVHSMKDVPTLLPAGLTIAAIGEREDPRDALVSNHFASLMSLPHGATIGTSSLRRQCLVQAIRPDLKIAILRGNIETRLQRLDQEQYAAIILAAAGLKRLGLQQRIKEYLAPAEFIPAVGQGALGMECRQEDVEILTYLQPLNQVSSYHCITLEREVAKGLNAGCHVPMAAYAHTVGSNLRLVAMVGHPHKNIIIRTLQEAPSDTNAPIAYQAINHLLAQGAADLLQEYQH